ncbi:efflux transporter outer membrane subunit [Stenotrophomonas sp. CC120223-11]|uniref:efflux transporter outer membrane subunit n=1 Tax=Stenotrophomonas sp. CC120223-11 TaxID=1378090 RepID=UPI000BC49129|nr:efflux transporter outer membrane subunit [Stenotrophomonas sp. CC120223-11]SNY69702.1 efflux transporter, outer membrane factor (OMF) lipoprotein, NodT family [Stenotrophomonas sp. CC120223-11]
MMRAVPFEHVARWVLPVCIVLAINACRTAGPDYRPPRPPAAGLGFASIEPVQGASAAVSNAPLPERWWRLYDDPALDALVQRALAANTDLRIAQARLEQARAQAREVRAAAGVGTAVSAGAGASQASSLGLGSSAGVHASFDAGISIDYDLDLAGRVKRLLEAQDAQTEAVAAARDLATIGIVSDVVRAYTDNCAAGASQQVVARSIQLQASELALIERAWKAGQQPAINVTRASGLLGQLQAQMPPLQAGQQSALSRLALLLGQAPSQLDAQYQHCISIPTMAGVVPAGEGADLIRRRPDVRAAERRLAAATARIGVETAGLYPSVHLGLSAGATSRRLDHLFDDSALRYSVGPLVSWSFPNRSVARARIDAADAASRAELAAFDGTVLKALSETEIAAATYAKALEENAVLVDVREAARLAHAQQLQMLKAGTVSALEALDVARSLAAAEQAVATSDATVARSRIALFLALGGGWES